MIGVRQPLVSSGLDQVPRTRCRMRLPVPAASPWKSFTSSRGATGRPLRVGREDCLAVIEAFGLR